MTDTITSQERQVWIKSFEVTSKHPVDFCKVEKRPRGYPQLASYVSADIDGRLYRRYGYLRNRLLLHKQDEIAELEEELEALDQADADHEDDWYRLCSRRFDEEDHDDRKRKKLLERIDEALKSYDDLLLREHQVMSIRQPTRKAHRGYFNVSVSRAPKRNARISASRVEDWDMAGLPRRHFSALQPRQIFIVPM